MRVVNTYAKYHLAKTLEECLQEAERAKKNMYPEACLQQCQYFSPFVASIYGILGVKAGVKLKMLAIRLAITWRQTYSRMRGYIQSMIDITLVRATHRCIWGSRVPSQNIRMQCLQ